MEQDPAFDPVPAYEETTIVDEASRSINASADGRITVDVDSSLAKTVGKLLGTPSELDVRDRPPAYIHEAWQTSLNIVIQVVGSRGDVQPFLALAHELRRVGHRVRIATHNVFENFVREAGLEFYPIGGDPAELMAFMVKNPGLIPNMHTLRQGEIQKKRHMIEDMMEGCWRACIEPDLATQEPFVADAIIANPPSFAHVHCAQALGVPLHLMFTMPWSPTESFPHPLVNMTPSHVRQGRANYISYGLVQYLTWQGLADVINEFRANLCLEPVPLTEGPFLAETLKIPYTYCWSPALVPKPEDWSHHIDVCGFFFRETPRYDPPKALSEFLNAGPPPVYIGFGSIVVDNPEELTTILLQAIKDCGIRAIISAGWSSLGSGSDVKDIFFLTDDCPHEWLFQHVVAVVHHGGAGTTACGLSRGQPTVVVPFFGDQPFWGDMIASAGAGPQAIPYKQLTAKKLHEAMKFCLTEEAKAAATAISVRMQKEDGVKAAVTSFHTHLSASCMSCDLTPQRPAVWTLSKPGGIKIKLSGVAAEVLVNSGLIKRKQLQMYTSQQIHIENRRWDPVTAAAAVQVTTSVGLLEAAATLWTGPLAVKKRAFKDQHQNHAQRQPISRTDSDTPSSTSTATSTSTTGKQVAQMVGASAMAVPKIYGAMLKGLCVDVPLAVTEGLRATPKLYGETVHENQPITGWKSGGIVAGKTFMTGIQEGLTDLAVQPTKGYQKEGAVGLGKGIGKGMVGTVTKTASALTGLVSYPAQGLYKSVYSVLNSRIRKTIVAARRVQDEHNYLQGVHSSEEERIIDRFNTFNSDTAMFSDVQLSRSG